MNSIESVIKVMASLAGSWPLIIFVLAVSIICTVALGFIQFRYFINAWKYMLFPAPGEKPAQADMTPGQAFINLLGASLGNGSIAGMATAVYSGGPGAAFWVVAIGFIIMSVRFAEVYLSTYFGMRSAGQAGLGGPMLYLRSVPGGYALTIMYAVFTLFMSFALGAGMQANSIALSLQTTWNVPLIVTAFVVLAFIAFVVIGGAARINKASEKLVPLKVAVFFVSSIIVLAYNYHNLGAAFSLIFSSAFHPLAVAGGALGYSVQHAMRFGIARSILATESGLGTAAILFGSTGSKEPVKDGIMSMVGTFISTLVCFMVALCIVVSGAWTSGATSTPLTIMAFSTAFGSFGGWVVSFLSVSFGVSVMVAYAYITKEAWMYLLGSNLNWLFNLLYCAIAFGGPLVNVNIVWDISEICVAGMLVANLTGIIYLLPLIMKGVKEFKTTHQG